MRFDQGDLRTLLGQPEKVGEENRLEEPRIVIDQTERRRILEIVLARSKMFVLKLCLVPSGVGSCIGSPAKSDFWHHGERNLQPRA
ncbi:hypothetical protein G6M50_06670 [Agrobacterium rhizogenes]|nr:hypothetical protein [Rhizobium rhizogenes]NTJ77482.1 hypothetical protein [Rhizobium rhizogenes]